MLRVVLLRDVLLLVVLLRVVLLRVILLRDVLLRVVLLRVVFLCTLGTGLDVMYYMVSHCNAPTLHCFILYYISSQCSILLYS